MGIYHEVATERARQHELKAEGRFTFTPSDVPLLQSLAMLLEEVGEVARAVLGASGTVQEELTVSDVRAELVQVAAVAIAMLEGIDDDISTANSRTPVERRDTFPFAKRLGHAPDSDRFAGLYTNTERTVLVTHWRDGLITVATRQDPWQTWGPPITVTPTT